MCVYFLYNVLYRRKNIGGTPLNVSVDFIFIEVEIYVFRLSMLLVLSCGFCFVSICRVVVFPVSMSSCELDAFCIVLVMVMMTVLRDS